MHDLILLIAHVLSMLVRLAGTGGVRSVIAESALLKHQLLIVNRPRDRAPNLRVTDRFIVAVCSLFIRPARLVRSTIILKPSTILNFQPKLGEAEISPSVSPEAKSETRTERSNAGFDSCRRRNEAAQSRLGCPRIAAQISLAFGVLINKDVLPPVTGRWWRFERFEDKPFRNT
jgi:putative transposase